MAAGLFPYKINIQTVTSTGGTGYRVDLNVEDNNNVVKGPATIYIDTNQPLIEILEGLSGAVANQISIDAGGTLALLQALIGKHVPVGLP